MPVFICLLIMPTFIKVMKMSAVFTTPIAAATFPVRVFKSTKFEKAGKLFLTRLEFGGEIHCRKYEVCGRKHRIMKGCNWVRSSTSDEGFEQEGSVAYADSGIQATINSLSKWLIGASFIGMNMWRHDGEAVWALMGSVFNDELSHLLKQILNQERPNSKIRSDPGMPSSHAQSITYTTIFIVMSIVELYGINALTTTLSGALIILGSYFAWLRVSQNLHTVNQVVVGAMIGTCVSFLWLWLWKAYVLHWFVSMLWVRLLIIVAATGFTLNHIIYTYRS